MHRPAALVALALLAGPCWGLAPPEAAVRPVIEGVDPDRLLGDVRTLAGFGTRHTLSETESDVRGIGAARRWLAAEFRRIADAAGRDDVTVELERFLIEPDGRRIFREVEVVNVVCIIPGAMPEAAGRRYYAIAHYDSRGSDVNDAEVDAPGANDDASGTALCLELARVLMEQRLDATVVLMPVAGEEQGLFGARRHAAAAREAGIDIRAVLSCDVVGDPSGPNGRDASSEVRVFSEGLPLALLAEEGRTTTALRALRGLSAESDSASRQLARYIAEVADLHGLPVRPRVIFRPDRFLRGGDHTAFNEVGYPAVRFTEVYEDYDRQHQDVREENGRVFGDLVEYIDPAYLAGVTKLNAASIVHLANAPSEPGDARIIVADLTNDTTLRWTASPEPDVAGYEIVWRETTAPFWQFSRDVGLVEEATVELSKDNWFFGVRAYDRNGFRSPVAFPRPARE
ncbi:MAG: M20/M25/M40 family metallo-hydrolase [Phycisphaerales bacterium]